MIVLVDCGHCFFSEMIDGVVFCHFLEVDIVLDSLCDNFVNVDRLKDILVEYDDCGVGFDEFCVRFRDLL